MDKYNELRKDLEALNPDELVLVLGISSEILLETFPSQVEAYITSNIYSEDYEPDAIRLSEWAGEIPEESGDI